jgi:SAM-dependent methyltransferase
VSAVPARWAPEVRPSVAAAVNDHPDADDRSAMRPDDLDCLPHSPADLEQTLAEIHRILRPGGRFLLVEPWLTSFLRVVHLACKTRLLRKLSVKLDSFATMVDHERRTYEQWFSQPEAILALLRNTFPQGTARISWGKLHFLAQRTALHSLAPVAGKGHGQSLH